MLYKIRLFLLLWLSGFIVHSRSKVTVLLIALTSLVNLDRAVSSVSTRLVRSLIELWANSRLSFSDHFPFPTSGLSLQASPPNVSKNLRLFGSLLGFFFVCDPLHHSPRCLSLCLDQKTNYLSHLFTEETQSSIFNVHSVQQLDPHPVKINVPSIVGVWIFSRITHCLTDENLHIF